MLSLLDLLGFLSLLPAIRAASCPSQNTVNYITSEIKFLASLKGHLAGSPQQNALIDRIESELKCLGLGVKASTWTFPYFDGPTSTPSLSINGSQVPITSYSARSGMTNSSGVTGEIVNLYTSSLEAPPDWKLAKGKIAVTNITNLPNPRGEYLSPWSGSPNWTTAYGWPDLNADALISNRLADAALAGVKGVVYVWQNVSQGLVEGTFSPSTNIYQGIPTLFTQGTEAELALLAAANTSTLATLKLEATIKPEHTTRTIWTVVEGKQYPNESIIITTHTDGVSTVEENGFIALMLKAADLLKSPPARTTILVWVSGHLQEASFSPAPGTATSRWLAENPAYWNGDGNTYDFQYGGQLKAVAASTVEHMGALHFIENPLNDTFLPTSHPEPELLYASTPQLNTLLRSNWVGADPDVTRITDPYTSRAGQLGEGGALFLADIPNFSLVTNPPYLVKIWDDRFDETSLVSTAALQRQADSFMRVWGILDKMVPGTIESVSKPGACVMTSPTGN